MGAELPYEGELQQGKSMILEDHAFSYDSCPELSKIRPYSTSEDFEEVSEPVQQDRFLRNRNASTKLRE
jgi:hypothetical protein